jgi:hypothetical protein
MALRIAGGVPAYADPRGAGSAPRRNQLQSSLNQYARDHPPRIVTFQYLGRAERPAVLLVVERRSFQSALTNADQARLSPRLRFR